MKSLLRTPPVDGVLAPPVLVASLRSIDERAELIHVGQGHWWLGVVAPNDNRTEQGKVILKFENERDHPNPRNVMLGRLLMKGFARINGYTTGEGFGAVDGNVKAYDGYVCSILEDFRERDYWWNKDGGKAKVAERIDASAGGPQRREAEALMADYTINDGRSHYRREIENRVQFGHGGMAGGAGHIITL
jgi:hypothetical protein